MNLPRHLQDLDPNDARFCLDIEHFLIKDLGVDLAGKHLLLALSGGSDSTALAVVCTLLSSRWKLGITAAHLDHGLRPESLAEAQGVASLCGSLDISLISHRIDVGASARSRGSGLEETARELRYDFLEQTRARLGADMVLTAHHLNDLAEDVLLRLLRGTGWPGLAGMPAVDPQRHLVRPFLLTPKKRLVALLDGYAIPWSEDLSNTDTALRRNRIRHEVLPVLESENPSFLDAVANLWRLGRLDETFWDDLLDEATPGKVREDEAWVLHDSMLRSCPQSLRLRLYKKTIEELGPGQALFQGLMDLDAAFVSKRRGKVFQFPGGKQIIVTARGLIFERGMPIDPKKTS